MGQIFSEYITPSMGQIKTITVDDIKSKHKLQDNFVFNNKSLFKYVSHLVKELDGIYSKLDKEAPDAPCPIEYLGTLLTIVLFNHWNTNDTGLPIDIPLELFGYYDAVDTWILDLERTLGIDDKFRCIAREMKVLGMATQYNLAMLFCHDLAIMETYQLIKDEPLDVKQVFFSFLFDVEKNLWSEGEIRESAKSIEIALISFQKVYKEHYQTLHTETAYNILDFVNFMVCSHTITAQVNEDKINFNQLIDFMIKNDMHRLNSPEKQHIKMTIYFYTYGKDIINWKLLTSIMSKRENQGSRSLAINTMLNYVLNNPDINQTVLLRYKFLLEDDSFVMDLFFGTQDNRLLLLEYLHYAGLLTPKYNSRKIQIKPEYLTAFKTDIIPLLKEHEVQMNTLEEYEYLRYLLERTLLQKTNPNGTYRYDREHLINFIDYYLKNIFLCNLPVVFADGLNPYDYYEHAPETVGDMYVARLEQLESSKPQMDHYPILFKSMNRLFVLDEDDIWIGRAIVDLKRMNQLSYDHGGAAIGLVLAKRIKSLYFQGDTHKISFIMDNYVIGKTIKSIYLQGDMLKMVAIASKSRFDIYEALVDLGHDELMYRDDYLHIVQAVLEVVMNASNLTKKELTKNFLKNALKYGISKKLNTDHFLSLIECINCINPDALTPKEIELFHNTKTDNPLADRIKAIETFDRTKRRNFTSFFKNEAVERTFDKSKYIVEEDIGIRKFSFCSDKPKPKSYGTSVDTNFKFN